MSQYLAPMPTDADGYAGHYRDVTADLIPGMTGVNTVTTADGVDHVAVYTDDDIDDATLAAWRSAIAAHPTPEAPTPTDVPSVADAAVAALAAGRSKEDVVRDVIDAITT